MWTHHARVEVGVRELRAHLSSPLDPVRAAESSDRLVEASEALWAADALGHGDSAAAQEPALNVYVDTSALIKVVLRESWEHAGALWEQATALVTSRIADVEEARAGLACVQRPRRLCRAHLLDANAELTERWSRMAVVELNEELAPAAGEVAEEFQLRAGDPMHLASALLLADPELVPATWDRQLGGAPLAAGLAVAP